MKLKLFYPIILILLSINLFSQVPDGFILVKAGRFTIGSPASEVYRGSDETQSQVTITRDFYIAKTEVTQGVWEDVMGTTIRQQRDKLSPDWPLVGEGRNYPMYYVSWEDAVEFCNRLSLRDGLEPCYKGSGDDIECNFDVNGYRLPTEAEWEYSARGGHKADSYQKYSGANNIDNVGWYADNSGDKVHPVGNKTANQLGLYDMSGNVWEWCWDWFALYNGSATDPKGATESSYRVLRGGSWGDLAQYCRSAYRDCDTPDFGHLSYGFRLVRSAAVD